MFVAGKMIGREFVFDEDRIPRYPPNGRNGFVLSIDADGKLMDSMFYTTGFTNRDRVMPMRVAANASDRIAVVGYFDGEVRAPTGEVIEGKWDGFLTVFAAPDRKPKD